jgi:hypothetical protein
MTIQRSGYEVLNSLEEPQTESLRGEIPWLISSQEDEHDQIHGEVVPITSRVVTSAPISTSAPSIIKYSRYPQYHDVDYEEREESPLLQTPFQDELRSPQTPPQYAAIAPSSEPQATRPKRSRSIISFDMRSLNDTVTRWTNSIAKWTSTSKSLDGVPNEIQYSVFKPPRGYDSLQRVPGDGIILIEPVTKTQFDAIVEDATTAIESGIKPKRISAGSSGSYFIYNTKGEIVGVFKPKDEEPYGPLSPKWTKWLHRNLFPCFFGRSCLIPNLGYVCESAASLLDRQLQAHIVPYTDIVSISSDSFYYSFWEKRSARSNKRPLRSKVGSFQLFLNDYQEADKFLSKYPLPGSGWSLRGFNHESSGLGNITNDGEFNMDSTPDFQWTPEVLLQFREELEKLVILDYIMRNTDRGLDNWMINLTWETTAKGIKKPRLKIRAIDSGLSWPWKHPDEWRSYPFGWLFLPVGIIGQPFSEKTRRHYLPLLTSTTWWEECSLIFRELFAKDDDFKERMWKKQWAVIKGQAFNVVETLKNPTQGPLELARRTRILVWDEIMEVPVHVPTAVVSNAIETPMFKAKSRPSPALNSIQEHPDNDNEAQNNMSELLSGGTADNEPQRVEEESGLVFAQDTLESKKVIIERLQTVTSKPPVFTWC